jgi:DNA-binding transcriptional MerR regulator
MLALRSALERAQHAYEPAPARTGADPADWLSLKQAACELGLSISTVRRMVRTGRLRHRIVPRRGGYTYLVYLASSRHARGRAHATDSIEGERPDLRIVSESRTPESVAAVSAERVRMLEQQVEHLSEALSRALKLKQKALPEGMGDPGVNGADPFARYRWLVRRRRWWPF